eukprot:g3746.t1
MSNLRKVLVYGGAGQLGCACLKHFSRAGWHTTSVDFSSNDDVADHSIQLPSESSWHTQSQTVQNSLLEHSQQFDLVLSVAGGWAGGDIGADDLIESMETMWQMNMHSAVVAAQVAKTYLKDGGLLVLTGAAAATGPTPGMLSYGVSKAATHHLTASLASPGGLFDSTFDGKVGRTAIAILPETIDTLSNRQGMPDADFSTWTDPDDIAKEVRRYIENPRDCPAPGSLVQCKTEHGETTFSVL